MAMTTMITAHTGCEGTLKNSLDFIQAALASGADCMEIDLRMQGDQAVLAHDPLEDGVSYVTLEQCLGAIHHSSIQVNCDLKGSTAFSSTLELFRKYGMESRLIFTGSYPLEHAEDEGCYRVFINVEQLVDKDSFRETNRETLNTVLENYAQYGRCARIAGLNLPHIVLTDEAVQIMKENSIPLSLWTVDDPADLRRALSRQVYNITTNRPVSAIGLRAEQDRR